jgi:hypothetical protein
MKQDQHSKELDDIIRLAWAVLSVQLEVLAARRNRFSVASANPADDKIENSFAQRAVLANKCITGR